jgi:hypothetical protein
MKVVTTAATASRPTILGRFANRIAFWNKQEYADFRIFMGNLGGHKIKLIDLLGEDSWTRRVGEASNCASDAVWSGKEGDHCHCAVSETIG